jgi:hypothetical protein
MNAPFAKMTKSKSKKSTGINKNQQNQQESKISTGIKWNQNDIKGESKSFHPWDKCQSYSKKKRIKRKLNILSI